MTRYFLHLRDGADELLDEEGSLYEDLSSLKAAVLFNAREIISTNIREGVLDLTYRIDAETAGGEVVYSLPFTEAVTIRETGG